jgi:hypothetical protein
VPGIISSRTRRLYSRPPAPPYALNRDSPQARGLVACFDLRAPNVNGYFNLVNGSNPLTPGAAAAAPAVESAYEGFGLAPKFVVGSSQYLECASAFVNALPVSMAVWFWTTDTANTRSVMSMALNTATNDRMNLATLSGKMSLAFQNGTPNANPSTTTSYAASTWQLATAVASTSVLKAVYLNGGGKATSSTSVAASGLWNRTRFSSQPLSTPSQFWDGRLAHGCVWSAALTDDEVWALYDPRTRWELYYPLGRKTWSFAPAAAAAGLDDEGGVWYATAT